MEKCSSNIVQKKLGKKPFVFKLWSDQGVFVLGNIFDNQRLRSFQYLKECYNLPGYFYFLYLRLRSAIHTYGVLWKCNLDAHPLMDFVTFSQTYGAVSLIYNKLFNPLGSKVILGPLRCFDMPWYLCLFQLLKTYYWPTCNPLVMTQVLPNS